LTVITPLDTSEDAVIPAYIIEIPNSTTLDPMAIDINSNSTGNGTDDTLVGDEGTAVIDNGSGTNSTEEKEEDVKDEID
jgi:hypothetical protein